MFKITIKYLIALLLSMMLIVSNTSAHHKSKKEKNVKTEWNGDSKTKKVFEKQSLAQYCALKAQAITIPGEPILDQNNKNDDGNPVQTKDVYKKEETIKVLAKGPHKDAMGQHNTKLISESFIKSIVLNKPELRKNSFKSSINSLSAVLAANVSSSIGGEKIDIAKFETSPKFSKFRTKPNN